MTGSIRICTGPIGESKRCLSLLVIDAGSGDKVGLDVLTHEGDVIRVDGVVVELPEVLTVSDEREVVLLRRIDIKLYV